MDILEVKIDNLSRLKIFDKIKSFLQEEKFHQIATVNPEFILQSQKDLEFRNILNDCDLNVADGVGVWFAFLRYGKYLKSRMAGIDLMLEILKLANENKLAVFLVSHESALSSWEETRNAILKKYPNLKINGTILDTECPKGHSVSILSKDNEIVFCNFGAPEQEKFLHSLKSLENSKIKLAMGVGGSFDFLTGRRKRAPICIRKAGLEWLWRFLQEPKYRAKRIFRAVIIFPIRVLFSARGGSA
jgi:N-acetylglucosaminyldiphosphoundecaprenol N-acetyl-beta-D-mannosaminyltransferase